MYDMVQVTQKPSNAPKIHSFDMNFTKHPIGNYACNDEQ